MNGVSDLGCVHNSAFVAKALAVAMALAEAKYLNTFFNYGCRLVLYKPRLYSASSARQELQFTTLSDRRKFHMCQTMYKCLNSLSLLYLTCLFDTPSTH